MNYKCSLGTLEAGH